MALDVNPDQPLFMPGDDQPLIHEEARPPLGDAPIGGLYQSLGPSIVTLKLDELFALGRKNSLWPAMFGIACCAIEMIGSYMANYDLDRMGILPFASPRQADVMLVAGTVNRKMARVVTRLWEQMPMPKWARWDRARSVAAPSTPTRTWSKAWTRSSRWTFTFRGARRARRR